MLSDQEWELRSETYAELCLHHITHVASCSVKQHTAVCRWLASKGQQEAAEQALRRLRGPDQIEADLAEMQAAAEEESKARSWALLRSPAVRGELQVGQPLRPVTVSMWCAMHLWSGQLLSLM